jgi:hypothetical protein
VSYDYPRDAFLVAAAAGYAPEAQVFISYGAQSNDSLLQMYGFVEPDNPHDVYTMTTLLKWWVGRLWLGKLWWPCSGL